MCIGCPEPKAPVVQRATRFWICYAGLKVHQGDSSLWGKLPNDGVLAVKVFFSDGTFRNCNGNDNYGLMLGSNGEWTIIHNDIDLSKPENAERYPTTLWKKGQWVLESEMNEALRLMGEAV